MNTEQQKLDFIYEKMNHYLKTKDYNNFNMFIRNTIDYCDRMEVTSILAVLRWATTGKAHTELWPFLVGAIINDLERRGYIKEQIDGLLIGHTGQINL